MGSQEQPSKSGSIADHRLNRRDFLKTAGFGAAALGVGGGLSGALAACGSEHQQRRQQQRRSGREIKVGFVSPLTGPLAAFGEADTYCVERWNETVKDGIDRRRQDASRQDHREGLAVRLQPRRQVAGDLMTNDSVDIMMVAVHLRHGQSGRRPGRGVRRALHLVRQPVAALLLGPRRHPRQALQMDLPRLLGHGDQRRVQLDLW